MGHPQDRLEELLTALGGDRSPDSAPVRDSGSPDVPRARHRGRRGGRSRDPAGPVPLLSLPVSLRTAHVGVSVSAVWGLVVVVVVVAAVLGVRVAWAQRQAAPEPVPVSSSASAATAAATDQAVDQGASASGAPPAPTAEGSAGPVVSGQTAPAAVTPPATADLVVHVIGAVTDPGVVQVPPGSRVQDAVDQAGGMLAQADPTRINLARAVLDGERIWVPVPGEDPPEDVGAQVAGPVPGVGAGTTANGAGAGGAPPAPVDLNTADAALLDTLPGVGPVTAESILAWRSEHGRFSTVEELLEVSGIGERTLEELRPLVRVRP